MGNNHYEIYSYETSDALIQNLSQRILHALSQGIAQRGYASMAVSGGSTPKKLFQALSVTAFPWEDVKLTLVDERWVDVKSEQSNEKLIRDFFIQDAAKRVQFYPLKTDHIRAEEAISELEDRLQDCLPTLDVVILGMGLDGHTASFFPHTATLEDALHTRQRVCATNTESVEPKERITLSRDALLKTQELFLHIEGVEKKAVFNQAAKSDDIQNYPIISMMQQNNPLLKVYYAH